MRPLIAVALVAALCAPGAPRGCAARKQQRNRRWAPYTPDGMFVPAAEANATVSPGLAQQLRGSGAAGAGDSAAAAAAAAGGAATANSSALSAPAEEWDPTLGDPDEGPEPPPVTGNAYKQLLARRPDGAVVWDADLNMTLPAAWDIVNLTIVLRDNLAPVARWWRQRSRKPRVRDLYHSALSTPLYKQSDTHRIVVIRNNVITFPLMPPGLSQFECDFSTCNPQLEAWLRAMRAAVHTYKLQLPDVVLSLSVQDGGGRCGRDRIEADMGECAAPTLSISQLDVASDLLAPMMLLPDANVTWRHAAWGAKSGRAFFRGVPSCGELRREPGVCGRTIIARLAQRHPELFDAGVVMAVHDRQEDWDRDPALQDGLGKVPVLPRVPRSALPLHKYLLSLDGHTAAYRFATLLGTNSLVLKQSSRQVEWFYASVRPWVHYVPILENRTDALAALAWAEAHPAEAGAIVDAANRFALTYTTYYSRVVYWVYALHAYKSLFADQEEFFLSRGAVVRDLVAAYHKQHRPRAAAADGGSGGDGSGGGARDQASDSGIGAAGSGGGSGHVRLGRLRRTAGGAAQSGSAEREER